MFSISSLGLTYGQAYKTLDPNAPAYWKKYRIVETRPNDSNGNQSSINIRLMRFADVLLMHAEAENEQDGPTANAMQSYNRVRARAKMDLKRWEILEERFKSPEVQSGRQFNISRNEYYPIPAIDITTNKNLVQYADY